MFYQTLIDSLLFSFNPLNLNFHLQFSSMRPWFVFRNNKHIKTIDAVPAVSMNFHNLATETGRDIS